MASLLVVLIISACGAYLYLKSTLVKSFAMVITAICAGVVAFGYFEILANVLIGRDIIVPWAQTACFTLLFVLAFAVLQTIAGQLTRRPIDLGLWPERIGRTICGIFLGLMLSGLLLTAIAMAPLSNRYPYQRFDPGNPDAGKPSRVLLNADGFATGWFGMISSGSFSGKRSFVALHPSFIDQVFLNRHKITEGVSIIAGTEAIKVPPKLAAWPGPEGLKDSNNKPLSPRSDHKLTIVRVGINKNAVKQAGVFTLSQLRLLCKHKNDAKKPLTGRAKGIYPVGYLKTVNQLRIKRLEDRIKIAPADFDGRVKWIDFAFYVPNDYVGVLVEFKQDNVAKLPAPVTAEQAPPPAPFVPLSECAKDTAELHRLASAKVYGVELAVGRKILADLTLEISDPNQWQNIQTAGSITPAQFEDGKINYVRAELKMQKPAEEEPEAPRAAKEEIDEERTFRPTMTSVKKAGGIGGMLKPLEGYKLLSLKCNSPSAGAVIKAEQLPFLVEASGVIHRPVGVIASVEIDDRLVYEFDYCSLTAEDVTDGLIIAEDGSVAKPFPDTIWLTEQTQSISEFYLLYLIESGRGAIITAVGADDSQSPAGFKRYEGFSIK